MADQFDVITVVSNWLILAGLKVYKDKAPITENSPLFVVVNSPVEVNFQVVNAIPVNINIYCKKNENGMISRSAMKTAKDKANQAIENGVLPSYLFDLSLTQSYINTTYSDKYDIHVSRYDITVTRD